MGTRTESDSFGPIEVDDEHYWGAQTQRSLEHFAIGDEKMPIAIVHALATIKKAAALVNRDLGLLPADIAEEIEAAESRDDRARLICDFLADQTDGSAARMYQRLFTPNFGSIGDLI